MNAVVEATRMAAARRRLEQCERQIQSAAQALGEHDSPALARNALDLAAHAALAVVVDAGLLHLLRINYFFDRPALPYWVEARLLLSPLFVDEGDGLYAIDTTLRNLLLERLADRYESERLRSTATLLWQYTERQHGWADRRELRHAQQLTALNFLAPDRAQAWLAEAESGNGQDQLAKEWFVAMRSDFSMLQPPPDVQGDPHTVCQALLNLVAPRLAATYRLAIKRLPIKDPGLWETSFMLSGPPGYGHRWQMLQLLTRTSASPIVLYEFDVLLGGGEILQLRSLIEQADPVQVSALKFATWCRSLPPRSGLIAAAVHGIERLHSTALKALLNIPAAGVLLFLLDASDTSAGESTEISQAMLQLGIRRDRMLPTLNRIDASTLSTWVTIEGTKLFARPGEPAPDEPAIAEIVHALRRASDDGIPERLYEAICHRAGVRWRNVQALARERFAPLTLADDQLVALARDYDGIRQAQSASNARTAAMERIVAAMRDAIGKGTSSTVGSWRDSVSSGHRLVAVVMLQVRPAAGTCRWLAERVATEKPFIGYHALLALGEAAKTLDEPALDEVSAALDAAEAALGPAKVDRTDRGAVLRQARELVRERRPYAPSWLPVLPLRGGVLLPGCTVELKLTQPGVRQALEHARRVEASEVFIAAASSLMHASDFPAVGTTARVPDFEAAGAVAIKLHGTQRAMAERARRPVNGGGREVLVRPAPAQALPEVDLAEKALADAALAALRKIDPMTRDVSVLSFYAAEHSPYVLAQRLEADDEKLRVMLAMEEVRELWRTVAGISLRRIRRHVIGAHDLEPETRQRLTEALSQQFDSANELRRSLDLLGLRTGGTSIEALVRDLAREGQVDALISVALAARPDAEPLWMHCSQWIRPKERGSAGVIGEHLPLWPGASELRLRFLGGTRQQQERARRVALQWFEHTNLRLRVAEAGEESDIRVAFEPNDGSWSYVGTDARNVPQDKPTMNLGWGTTGSPKDQDPSAVLKPFGHALGLIHEHQNPNANLDWNVDAVMKDMSAPPNSWSRADIEKNLLTPAPVKGYRPFDPYSVMLYPIQAHWLRSGKTITGGKALSNSDKTFIAHLYPNLADSESRDTQSERIKVPKLEIVTWRAGSTLFRALRNESPPNQPRPSLGADLLGLVQFPDGASVPIIYAAQSASSAVFETLAHAGSGSLRAVSTEILGQYKCATLRLARDLSFIVLSTTNLALLGVGLNQFLDPKNSRQKAEITRAIRLAYQEVDGLAWPSRHVPNDLVFCLFGDRMNEGDLLVDEERPFLNMQRELADTLERLGIPLILPSTGESSVAGPRDPVQAARRKRVFISYAHDYRRHAEKLAGVLTADVDVEWDGDLPSGERWEGELRERLERANAILVIVGSRTASQKWAATEIRRSIELGKQIIPVFVDVFQEPSELLALTCANSDASGHVQWLEHLSGHGYPGVIYATAMNVLRALDVSSAQLSLEQRHTYETGPNRYYNPPSDVQKLARRLDGENFRALVSQLGPSELLMGLYENRAPALVATHIHSRLRLEEMEASSSTRLGFFAIEREVANQGWPEQVPARDSTFGDAAAAAATVHGENLIAVAIPDNNPIGVSSKIRIAATGVVQQLALSIDITHTYVGDLLVELTGPSGAKAVLHDRTGASSHDLSQRYHSAAVASLAALVGQRAEGAWVLRVSDFASQDVGMLMRWSLDLTVEAGAPAASGETKRPESVQFEDSRALTSELRIHLTSAFEAFQDYLAACGYRPTKNIVTVFVDPDLKDNVYYDKSRIVLGAPMATDTDAFFRECSHHALLRVGYEALNKQQLAIESGLADYFPCSFNNDPQFGEQSIHLFKRHSQFKSKTAIRMLENSRHYQEATLDPEVHSVGEIWGGAFWELRRRAGPHRADRLLFQTWHASILQTRARDFGRTFITMLISGVSGARSDSSDPAKDVAEIFTSRGFGRFKA